MKENTDQPSNEPMDEYSDEPANVPISTYLIVWKSDTSKSEQFLKKVLDDNKISYKDLDNQKWEPSTSTIGGIRDYKLSMIGNGGNSWNTLLLHLNSELGIKIATSISKEINSPVIIFLEYDQSAWGYKLIKDGSVKNFFCNDPDLVGIDKNKCKADLKLLIEYFNVKKDNINPYLKHISEEDEGKKAFPEDEFELSDHWVRVDFMKKLGIIYPDTGTWIYIQEKGIND